MPAQAHRRAGTFVRQIVEGDLHTSHKSKSTQKKKDPVISRNLLLSTPIIEQIILTSHKARFSYPKGILVRNTIKQKTLDSLQRKLHCYCIYSFSPLIKP